MKEVLNNWCSNIIKEYKTKKIETHKDCLILIFAIIVPWLIYSLKDESVSYLISQACKNNKDIIDNSECLNEEIEIFREVIKGK